MNIDFKTLFTVLKNIDFSYIISELKSSRKGVTVIIFFVCLLCAAIDYFLRKHGIVYDWFIQAYFPIGAISFTAWAIKVFNRIADEVDKNKISKSECVTAIHLMPDNELNLIREFITSGTPSLLLEDCPQNAGYLKHFQELGIIKEYSIADNTISIIFKKDFVLLFKKTLEKLNLTSLSK